MTSEVEGKVLVLFDFVQLFHGGGRLVLVGRQAFRLGRSSGGEL